ncbi:MAG TPA: sigma-70 family RNA polymerase sigma factor [Bacteroidales bacterium]|nr:sigma-70 family RNA polymerase sigma factor [Bacteroidales bacterium]
MFLNSKHTTHGAGAFHGQSDENLIAQYILTGNKDYVAVLFERYTHLVYGICLNYLHETDQCKDAVMEIFESLFEKLADHKVSCFKNWLYSVSRNYCLMSLRKTGAYLRLKYHIHENARAEELEINPVMNSVEQTGVNSGETVVLAAVGALNREQEACIRLMYLENRSYRDISEITGFSPNEVKSHIQNGKRNLKNYLLGRNDHQILD